MEKIRNFLKDNLSFILLLILILIVKVYVVSPIRVNGESMTPTLDDRDIMILDEISYRFSEIKRFDIVVVRINGEYLIKRVIGLPGDVIRYEVNTLYINDKKVEENFERMETEDFETKVPKNQYFVMGDNRTNSVDSRRLGAFTKKQILGKTNFVVYPFHRFGTVSDK